MPHSSFTCKDYVSCVIKYIDAAAFHARYYLQHMKHINNSVPPMRGHLQCRDTFAWIQECPLKRGTTVQAVI